MKSDAPKGENIDEQDHNMEPSMDEDESEMDSNFDPLGKNRWAEPHGLQQPSMGMPGQMNGYAAHIARQR